MKKFEEENIVGDAIHTEWGNIAFTSCPCYAIA